MALDSSDRIGSLPPELLSQILAHVLTDDDGNPVSLEVQIRKNRKTRLSVNPFADISRNDEYVAHRIKGTRKPSIWPDNVEAAFLKAFEWVYRNYKISDRGVTVNKNEVVGHLTHEFSGAWRGRKQVASHVQTLLVFSSPSNSHNDTEDNIRIDSFLNALAGNVPTCKGLHSLIYGLDRPFLKEKLSIRLVSCRCEAFRPLLRISHGIRDLALHHLEYQTTFDFSDDVEALQAFATLVEPMYLKKVRRVHFDFIGVKSPPHSLQTTEGWSACMNRAFVNLKLLEITLVPRDPTDGQDSLDMNSHVDLSQDTTGSHQRHWNSQTHAFLSSLHEVECRVGLHLKWVFDCRYFDRLYVDTQKWMFAGKGEMDIGPSEPGRCHKIYELCQRKRTREEV